MENLLRNNTPLKVFGVGLLVCALGSFDFGTTGSWMFYVGLSMRLAGVAIIIGSIFLMRNWKTFILSLLKFAFGVFFLISTGIQMLGLLFEPALIDVPADPRMPELRIITISIAIIMTILFGAFFLIGGILIVKKEIMNLITYCFPKYDTPSPASPNLPNPSDAT